MNSPQIITADFGGRHNADLEGSARRVLEGGSWKKQRVIEIMPSATMIPAKVSLSHRCLIYPPNQAVHRMLALGLEVGEAYSNAIEQILAHGDLRDWEYILTLEHDNCPPGDGIVRLIEDMERHPEYAVIGGLYWTKGEAGVAQLWGDPSDPQVNFRPQVPRPNTLQEVCGTGMGFTLYRLSMFKDDRLRRPWFKTLNGSEGTGVGTQDLYFAADARKYGYRFAVDTRVVVGHYDSVNDIIW